MITNEPLGQIEQGSEPTKTFSIRVPASLYDRTRGMAAMLGISYAQFIREALSQATESEHDVQDSAGGPEAIRERSRVSGQN